MKKKKKNSAPLYSMPNKFLQKKANDDGMLYNIWNMPMVKKQKKQKQQI